MKTNILARFVALALVLVNGAHAATNADNDHVRPLKGASPATTEDQPHSFLRLLAKGGGGGGGGGCGADTDCSGGQICTDGSCEDAPTCSTEKAKECQHCNGPDKDCKGQVADVCCPGYACTNGLWSYGSCALITPPPTNYPTNPPTPPPTLAPTTAPPTITAFAALNACCDNWCNDDTLWDPANLQGPQIGTAGGGSSDGCVSPDPCDCTSSNWNTLSWTINQHSSSGYNKCNAFDFNSDPNNGYAPYADASGVCTSCSADGSHCGNIDITIRGEISLSTGHCDCIASVVNNNFSPAVTYDVTVWSDDCTETNYDERYDESCGGEPRFQPDYVPNICGL